ncbi:DNA-binding FadR family transcriptional regulator [Mycobacterium frederiksbergense]|uniref:DNA-binding FadR family transcriptional regulator n=1 Tax=Mycolicibacterium frederiksbergense TaxID=117567 RepID=A0ABT6L177_9MYCO|nr:FCD domain-containing protein [Mycolicibacterium frederiksbergense]MDH6196703.1 DNA-binding FadR family transcriptional regulator [Mycolicibacterium frederiksbergense]
MDALARVPLSQQAAEALLDDVRGGRWEVGQQLPGEIALAAELNVGRSTIREAIGQLVTKGVLTTRHGVGAFLASTTPVEPWDRLAQVSEIAEVMQVRVAIECRAAALAATHHSRGDAAAIRRALKTRNGMLDASPAALAAADIEVHRLIVDAAGNRLLAALFDSIQPRLVAAMTDLLTIVCVADEDAEEHSAIVDAILARDAESAERLTRTHLLDLAAQLEAPRED